MGTVASPRKLYLINDLQVNLDDDPDVIDNLPGAILEAKTTRAVVAKIKKGIGDFLGLEPMDWDNPLLTGVFGGDGLNKGYTYRRNLGGFKVASYTLIAREEFDIEEIRPNLLGRLRPETNQFKTVSIGLPKGHSVHAVITWLSKQNNFDQIAAIRTPAGRKIPLDKAITPLIPT